jgi:tRNA A-37 threonylcarbamoyl transferase component Bud32
MKIIKELKGHSGSQILLMQDQNIFVRKNGNVTRNLERYNTLSSLGLHFPKILRQDDNSYDMEYVPNLDIKNFLLKNQIHRLAGFIKDTINKLSKNSYDKDYTDIYNKKLQDIDFSSFIFDKDSLLDRLPKILPSSAYHGDLTLENILYEVENGEFILIDPLTTEYDSYVFDLAKLRQDIICKWFIRNDQLYIDPKLQSLSEELEKEFEYYSDPYILILMLLRVLPYVSTSDKQFIIKEANKLWK